MEMPDLPETPTPDILSGANNQPWDCTTTGVEMVEKQSRLPTTENRQYLHIKVEYAMRFPQLSAQIRRKGKTYQMSLKQTVMSGLIRVDEIARNYCWYYKAEVAFDMRTTPPRPFLSSTLLEKDGAGRRHTTNPFPVPGKGIYRRPDVIIVKNKEDRWPGLAGPDTEGNMHSDNLARLVEVKFPGDVLSRDQYDEYMQIVGRNRARMTILEIHDCRPEEHQWVDQVVNVTMKAWQTSGAKYWPLALYPPVFMPRPPSTPVAARIEPWTYAGKVVSDLSEGVVRGVAEGWNALSKETQLVLNSAASWLNDIGEWVYRQGSEVWVWASQTGKSVKSWTNAQIKAAWTEIQHVTDMTLDMLKQVDWVQVLTNVAKTVGVILVAVGVGGLVVTLGIPEAIIGAFLLIVRLAINAWGTLATILGTGTAVLAVG
ncbi:VRR-NUC domain-containing protein [Escherichia marmotae]|uniref:VRR-NUC domain-containing protein n=1 Tax=Escherichia marmotae TaxID=1499973 RepID=UPI0016900B9E|nr:VRR-NUC domain-containing protein [Escherichia marmotae]EFJ2946584.1 VRR-NUC domain-containing protein [Escherichia coli]EHW0579883.1 VRR-NUC domain-containing protein [Escherichia coli]MDF1125509.1 VRR-NUC domain-containing protein [Escherichia coli]MDQ9241549.1 VRR-NUC domain-containing protein [Escherichia marmotae]HBC8853807.1 VRR-NUC domain-containing protein [Escherichia coli]